jgi:glycosyltransferase involved in cell wall biosynthesis
MSVLVLLPTFNGALFLREQLNSIFQQEGVSVKIVASDDGSTDGTVAILKEFDIEILPFKERLYPSQNVSKLLNRKAPYVALADQDDVWKKDKLLLSLKKMKEMEEMFGKNTPLLVHTDLEVVDVDLNRIAPSFFKYSRLNPLPNFKSLLTKNSVTGCTILMNEPLVTLAMPIPSEAIMHDWWIALVASAFGKIGVVDKPLVSYRQHKNNTVGAVSYYNLIKRIKNFFYSKRKKELQKAVFLEKYKGLV